LGRILLILYDSYVMMSKLRVLWGLIATNYKA